MGAQGRCRRARNRALVTVAVEPVGDEEVRPGYASRAHESPTRVVRGNSSWTTAARIAGLLHKVLMFATAAPDDSTMADARAAAGKMPLTPATNVVVVTDEATCRKASRAFDQWFWTTPRGAAVHLVQAGQRYVILATERAGSTSRVTDVAPNAGCGGDMERRRASSCVSIVERYKPPGGDRCPTRTPVTPCRCATSGMRSAPSARRRLSTR